MPQAAAHSLIPVFDIFYILPNSRNISQKLVGTPTL